MKTATSKQAGLTEGTCPLYAKDFSGYCEDCVQRGDCMLKTILHKVETLEARIEQLSLGRA